MIGATILPVGIAFAATGEHVIGSVITLAAAAVLIAGLHTFGRAGPDPGEPERDERSAERDP
jgi:hypothetical protein